MGKDNKATETKTIVKAERMDNLVPQQSRALTPGEVVSQVKLIQNVLEAVMVKDVHYGIIPGCKKPSLLKAGAEKLALTFRLAPGLVIEDMATDEIIRYRVLVNLNRIPSSDFVGSGCGECSSAEEKYQWKRTYSDKEWDATPENQRRVKYKIYNGRESEERQIKTNPYDIANTILKMAKKRAFVDAILTCTAASDLFEQDIEEMDEALLHQNGNQSGKPVVKQPEPVDTNKPQDNKPATPGMIETVKKKLKAKALGEDAILKQFKAESIDKLTVQNVNDILKFAATID